MNVLKPFARRIGEQFEHRLVREISVGPPEGRMHGRGQPGFDDLLELAGGHAGVGGGDELQERLLAAGQGAFEVAFEQRRKRLSVLPLRMLWRKGLDAIQGEEELEIERLLRPQCAVVVERGDAFGGRNEVGAALLRHLRDELDDGSLRRAVSPRGKRVGGVGAGREDEPERCQ
jgi:hypothetical protein